MTVRDSLKRITVEAGYEAASQPSLKEENKVIIALFFFFVNIFS